MGHYVLILTNPKTRQKWLSRRSWPGLALCATSAAFMYRGATGSVKFVSTSENQRATILVTLDYTPRVGRLGVAITSLFGERCGSSVSAHNSPPK